MRAIGNAIGVGLVFLFLIIMAFGTIQTAFFPREKTPEEKAQDAAYLAAQEKLKREEVAYRAERDARNRRVMECVPAGAENLNPKIFSAMVDRCEREALVQEAHEEAVDAGLKEKWNAAPLYPDEEEEGVAEAKAPDLDVSGTASDQPAPQV